MDVQSTTPLARFPRHGPIACRRCFTDPHPVADIGPWPAPWRAVNDPGAWGSATPEVIVLGFSKGFTQAGAYSSGEFDAVPFANMRPRLTEVLRVLRVIGVGENVDQRMVAAEKTMAFGSLVRCSLSRWSAKNRKYECTGPVMTKAFTEAVAPMVSTCARTYLADLPSSVRLVVMLGVTDSYIRSCRELIRTIYGSSFAVINAVGYQTGDVVWVHASHPSPLNGWHRPWVDDPETTTSGRKRMMALDAVTLATRGKLPRDTVPVSSMSPSR